MTIVSGRPPAGTTIDADGLLTIGPDCSSLAGPAVIKISVVDPCNGNDIDSVFITIGEVILGIKNVWTKPGAQGVLVDVGLSNPDFDVKAIQTEIMEVGSNYMTCTGCTPDPDRALEYFCTAREDNDGKCNVVLVSTNPSGMIERGNGTVFTVEYDIDGTAPADGCVDIAPSNSTLADRFNDRLCVCEEGGEVCFIQCGDIYPKRCPPDMLTCGDGIVNIFDILEGIDFVLGSATPSACQLTRADMPNGTMPYCSAPNGTINILDVLVIIDMALGKANCCDYYYFGKIY